MHPPVVTSPPAEGLPPALLRGVMPPDKRPLPSSSGSGHTLPTSDCLLSLLLNPKSAMLF